MNTRTLDGQVNLTLCEFPNSHAPPPACCRTYRRSGHKRGCLETTCARENRKRRIAESIRGNSGSHLSSRTDRTGLLMRTDADERISLCPASACELHRYTTSP